MKKKVSPIFSLLMREDIEGLIKLGAPRDEYASEAKALVAALSKLKEKDLNKEAVASLLALIWTKAFSLSAIDIEKRIPLFRRLAAQIVQMEKEGG